MNIFREFFTDPLKHAQQAKQVKSPDEELSREFVCLVFAAGREACRSISEGVRDTTRSEYSFPINDDASIEVSLAILGTSLAAMKGHLQVMPADRGARIETFCKRSIQKDCGLTPDSANQMIVALDAYQAAFTNSIAGKKNPFDEPSGIMLVRWLGPRIDTLFVPGTTALNPATHQLVGGLLTLTVNKVLTFWKGNRNFA
jgi:hypothetical protein